MIIFTLSRPIFFSSLAFVRRKLHDILPRFLLYLDGRSLVRSLPFILEFRGNKCDMALYGRI